MARPVHWVVKRWEEPGRRPVFVVVRQAVDDQAHWVVVATYDHWSEAWTHAHQTNGRNRILDRQGRQP